MLIKLADSLQAKDRFSAKNLRTGKVEKNLTASEVDFIIANLYDPIEFWNDTLGFNMGIARRERISNLKNQ